MQDSKATKNPVSPTVNMGGCLWQAAQTPGPTTQPGQSSPACTDADVVIIGAGYTGLWTALWLKKLAPHLSVLVLEKYTIGHGASGRNGGWLMGSLEGLSRFRHHTGKLKPEVLAELRGLVSSVVETLNELHIDCDLRLGGGLFGAARYAEQKPRAESMLHALWNLGFSEHDYHWLSPLELRSRVNVSKPLGAIATPHVATLNPGKLIHNLARVVQSMGVTVSEYSAAVAYERSTVWTAHARIRCRHVVLATEGYSDIAPLNRRLLSVQSGMVCTQPLSDQHWQRLGFAHHEAFCDLSRASTYLQRTADNRLVIGARGSYQWGNKAWHPLIASKAGTRKRVALAQALFQDLSEVQFTHAWEGSLGIARSFSPYVVFDKHNHTATAGGYMGEGVGASFLFGRTLAESIAGVESPRLHMPWVAHGNIKRVLKRWEFEPLPWLGFTTMMAATAAEDAMLSRGYPGAGLMTKLCNSLESLLGVHGA